MTKIKSSGRKKFGSEDARPALDPELLSLMKLVEGKCHPEAEAAARRILGRRPNQPLAMKVLSFALVELRRFDEALPILRHLVKNNAHDPEIQNNLGIALCELMFWEDALAAFRAAMDGLPRDPEIAKHMGVALARMHRWNDAVPYFLKAIELHEEDYVEAIEALASSLLAANRVDESWVCYKELHESDPLNPSYLFQLVQVSLRRCEWGGLETYLSDLRRLYEDYTTCGDSPFGLSALPGITPAELLRVSHQHAQAMVPKTLLEPRAALPLQNPAGRRLRIGYLSGDYRRHPVGFIIPELLERHDRSRFETFAYSTQPADPDDPIRERLVLAFEHFRDVQSLSVRDLRSLIREDGIDILVDLAGWTAHGRPEALAMRCAPVQVNWLGYPGSMGHPAFADYIIGDPTVTPLEHAAFYSETIAQLPYCYLPADTKRKIAERPSRASQGLPEGKFIYCSLNNSYKYNPQIFDLWCDILRGTPDSILWLAFHSDTASENLRAEFVRRDVAPERLFFAQRVPGTDTHLARLGLADVALDPFPYNSHSTAVDTLWAGVPMIAMLGDIFASRVGASALKAVGLSELVAEDVPAYREIAVGLYHDPVRLQALRQRLEARPSNCALFDMPAFARALESLFLRMIEDTKAGVRQAIS